MVANKMSEEMKTRLTNIWEKGLKLTDKTANLPENNIGEPIGRVGKKLNEAIKKALEDKNLDLKEQNITLRQVWHINDKHGIGNERRLDQNPITKETFMLIPDILKNFDNVTKGDWTKNSKGQNVKSVEISKSYSSGMVILADAIVDKDKLEIKTMVLKKTDWGKV